MPRVEVKPWTGSRRDADPNRALLVLPGMGYTPSMPLLMLPMSALAEMGWNVWCAAWDLSDVRDDQNALNVTVREAASQLMAAAGDPGEVMVLAKSIGSLAAPWVADKEVPAVWLTPLLNRQEVQAGVGESAAPALLVGGTADPSWDGCAAQGFGQQVVEVADGDHSLFTGEWRVYLDDLRLITERIVTFANSCY